MTRGEETVSRCLKTSELFAWEGGMRSSESVTASGDTVKWVSGIEELGDDD